MKNRQTRETPPRQWWVMVCVGIAAVWLTNHFGWWWATAVIGLVVGLVRIHSVRSTMGLAIVIGLFGWMLPLLAQWTKAPIWAASGTISGVMGFGTGTGIAVWVLTAVIGILLSTMTCWLGTAIRSLA